MITLPFMLLLTQFLAVSTVVALFFPLQEYLVLLGVSGTSAGFILGADALAALLVQPLITPFVVAGTARRWLLAGALLLAAALFMEGTVTNPVLFAAARLLQGCGFICVVAGLMPLFVLCINPEMSGRAFGLISLVRLLPYAVVPPLFEALNLAPSSLATIIRWSSLLALFSALLLWPLPRFPQELQPTSGSSFAGLRESLGNRDLVLLFGATVLLYAGYSMVFFFLKGFGIQYRIAATGLFFTVATLVMMIIRLLGGSLFDRYDKRTMNFASLTLAAVSVLLLPLLASSSFWLLMLAGLCGLGWGVSMPLLNALIFDCSPPEQRGLNQNVSLVMLQGGFFAGPLIGGWLLEAGGYRLLFATGGVILLIAAICTVLPGKNRYA